MINAQEAYSNTLLNLKDLDTTDLFIRASNQIEEAIKNGAFVTGMRQIENLQLAEKFAIQMEKMGYCCSVFADQPIVDEMTKHLKPTSCVTINWKFMPGNTREDYNNL